MKRSSRLVAILGAAVSIVAVSTPAGANVDTVDTTYGVNGRATVDDRMCGDAPPVVATRPAASYVARNGSTTILLQRVGGGGPDCDHRFRLARITPQGLPDHSFGPGGFREFSSATLDTPFSWAMVVDSLGRTYLISEQSSGVASLVRRYAADGTLDTTYGNGGQRKLSWPNNTYYDQSTPQIEAHADSNGRLILSRRVTKLLSDGTLWSRTMIVRLTSSGTPDPAFSSDGYYTVPIALNHGGQARFLTGKTLVTASGYLVHGIYAAGASASGPHTYFVISTKLGLDGRPVGSYGSNGIAYTQVRPKEGFPDNYYTVDNYLGSGLDSQGRLLVSWRGGGPAANGLGGWGMQTVRITTSGTLDRTFGSSGYLNSPTINTLKCLVDEVWVVSDHLLVSAACGSTEIETMAGLSLTGAPWTAINGRGVLGYWDPDRQRVLNGRGDLLGRWHPVGRHIYITYPDYGTGGIVERIWV